LGDLPKSLADFRNQWQTSRAGSRLSRADLSKVEAGRMEFRPERVAVSGVIREVLGILGALAAEKQMKLLWQTALPSPEAALGPPPRLR
jgi:hypothetical protein